MSLDVNYISAQETIQLRHLVLRSGYPKHYCNWEGDHLKSTKHVGAFLNSECVGILSVFKNQTKTSSSQFQYQLRGMAVHPEYQGQGIGKALVIFIENELKAANCQLLWCNARSSATAFYKKLGYNFASEEFMIQNVGPHYVMSKNLTKDAS